MRSLAASLGFHCDIIWSLSRACRNRPFPLLYILAPWLRPRQPTTTAAIRVSYNMKLYAHSLPCMRHGRLWAYSVFYRYDKAGGFVVKPHDVFREKASDAILSCFDRRDSVSLKKLKGKARGRCRESRITSLVKSIENNKTFSLDMFFSVKTH